ncbi:hypothetical protein CYMTET_11244, partial [Cymbomonas tetramitiformis]
MKGARYASLMAPSVVHIPSGTFTPSSSGKRCLGRRKSSTKTRRYKSTDIVATAQKPVKDAFDATETRSAESLPSTGQDRTQQIQQSLNIRADERDANRRKSSLAAMLEEARYLAAEDGEPRKQMLVNLDYIEAELGRSDEVNSELRRSLGQAEVHAQYANSLVNMLQNEVRVWDEKYSRTAQSLGSVESEKEQLLAKVAHLQAEMAARDNLQSAALHAKTQELQDTEHKFREQLRQLKTATREEIENERQTSSRKLAAAVNQVYELEESTKKVDEKIEKLQGEYEAKAKVQTDQLKNTQSELTTAKAQLSSVTESLGGALVEAQGLIVEEVRRKEAIILEMSKLQGDQQREQGVATGQLEGLMMEKQRLEAQVQMLHQELDIRNSQQAELLQSKGHELEKTEMLLAEVRGTLSTTVASLHQGMVERAEQGAKLDEAAAVSK